MKKMRAKEEQVAQNIKKLVVTLYGKLFNPSFLLG